MVAITFRFVKEYIQKYPDSKIALIFCYRILEKAKWKNLAELKKDFPDADYVGNDRYVLNVNGKKYRLIIMVHFAIRTVYFRWFGTHAEYDKIKNIASL